MARAARLSWKDAALFGPAVLMFLYLAGDGLRSGLFPDEMMNIYGYWREPWGKLLRMNLLFHEGGYRPAGAFFYRPLFDAFGFNPLPYRAVCFGLLLANLSLVYLLVRRLSASPVAASLAALLFSYNAYCSDLYYSSGTIFDLLCFISYAGALMLYSVWREGGPLSIPRLAALGALQVFALNAKEMAATLPAALVLMELLFRPGGKRDYRPALLTMAICGISMWGRLAGSGSMAGNPAYRPSLSQAKEVLAAYTGQLLYQLPMAGPYVVAGLIATLILCALFVRAPHIRYAAIFSLVTPLPVLLISQRSLYVMYIPMLGLAMLAGSLLAKLIPARFQDRWPAVAATVGLAALLLPLHLKYKPDATSWMANDEPKVRSITAALSAQLPTVGRGARVYFEEDPFPEDDWILTMLFRLYYRDDTIDVGRRKRPEDSPLDRSVVLALQDKPWRLKRLDSPAGATNTPSSPSGRGTGAP